MSIRKITGDMLIRPCDVMYVIQDNDNYANVMQMPQGAEQGNEFGDTIYELNGFVPYHEHEKGFETFLCSGPVETYINGKRFITEKGDLIHIRPYTNHFFRHLQEGSIWREIFQGVHMYSSMAYREFMDMYSPGINQNEEFSARRRMKYSGSYFWKEEPLVEDVSRYDVPECKPHDWAFESYEFPGITLNLKVGRWEHEGTKEIWELAVKRGTTINWGMPHGDWDLFWVTQGKFHVDADGQSFTAQTQDIVNVHPYCKHKFTFIEDSKLLAMNVKSQLFRAMEEIKLLKLYHSEQAGEWATIHKILDKHDCMITEYAYKPE